MVRTFFALLFVFLGSWSFLRQGGAEPTTPPKPQLSTEEHERRSDVIRRHEKELRSRPDVLGLLGSEEEIIIVTDRPESIPKEIEGIPVTTVPPPPVLPPPPGVIVLKKGVFENISKMQLHVHRGFGRM
jgi:hypothetical protein